MKKIINEEVITMTLTKWKPMTDLLSIHGEMNRLFDDFFTPRPLHRRLLEDVWHPSVDVAENADGIIITAELPGMTEDDVDISIIDSVLTLGGEKKQEKEICFEVKKAKPINAG